LRVWSKTSAEEFVAETFSLLVQGKKLPSEVLNLYRKCEGPVIKPASGGGGGGFQNPLSDFMTLMNKNGSYTETNLLELNKKNNINQGFITLKEAVKQGPEVDLSTLNSIYSTSYSVGKGLTKQAQRTEKIMIEA